MRSRWSDTYGQVTPDGVFLAADQLAMRLRGSGLTFDRQASHINVMPLKSWTGPSLPFISLWSQPGSDGVDMFLQSVSSWTTHINFIHPATPTIDRVLVFLPATQSRAIVVIPWHLMDDSAWWSNLARQGGEGVIATRRRLGFVIVAIDHIRRYTPARPPPPSSTRTRVQ